MSLALAGLGTAVPATRIDQVEAMAVARAVCRPTAEQATWLPGLYSNSGIDTRHLAFDPALICDLLDGTRHSGSPFLPTGQPDDRGPSVGQRMRHYVEHAGPLTVRAARQALARSGLEAARISHLVTVSCTGFRAPGVDVEVIKRVGLAPTVQRTNVGFMGCHGALNGLRVARAFVEADPAARVLLCAVELCGLHYHYDWDPQRMIANALFADGAAAVVGVPGDAAPPGAWRVAANGACLFPDCEDAMTWTVGDHNFEMTLSKRVPGLIGEGLRAWLQGWLADNGVALNEVKSWAIHPGGPRILSAVEEALGLGPEEAAASRQVFADHGNMSSPTVLFILERLRSREAPRPCVALGFGPGLAAEAALLR
ncbi:MAG TPA: type III polyketide synthase [Gemmataceae bacterium]|nr:type III polyketide synthase [Gemmataceae bacterium]